MITWPFISLRQYFHDEPKDSPIGPSNLPEAPASEVTSTQTQAPAQAPAPVSEAPASEVASTQTTDILGNIVHVITWPFHFFYRCLYGTSTPKQPSLEPKTLSKESLETLDQALERGKVAAYVILKPNNAQDQEAWAWAIAKTKEQLRRRMEYPTKTSASEVTSTQTLAQTQAPAQAPAPVSEAPASEVTTTQTLAQTQAPAQAPAPVSEAPASEVTSTQTLAQALEAELVVATQNMAQAKFQAQAQAPASEVTTTQTLAQTPTLAELREKAEQVAQDYAQTKSLAERMEAFLKTPAGSRPEARNIISPYLEELKELQSKLSQRAQRLETALLPPHMRSAEPEISSAETQTASHQANLMEGAQEEIKAPPLGVTLEPAQPTMASSEGEEAIVAVLNNAKAEMQAEIREKKLEFLQKWSQVSGKTLSEDKLTESLAKLTSKPIQTPPNLAPRWSSGEPLADAEVVAHSYIDPESGKEFASFKDYIIYTQAPDLVATQNMAPASEVTSTQTLAQAQAPAPVSEAPAPASEVTSTQTLAQAKLQALAQAKFQAQATATAQAKFQAPATAQAQARAKLQDQLYSKMEAKLYAQAQVPFEAKAAASEVTSTQTLAQAQAQAQAQDEAKFPDLDLDLAPTAASEETSIQNMTIEEFREKAERIAQAQAQYPAPGIYVKMRSGSWKTITLEGQEGTLEPTITLEGQEKALESTTNIPVATITIKQSLELLRNKPKPKPPTKTEKSDPLEGAITDELPPLNANQIPKHLIVDEEDFVLSSRYTLGPLPNGSWWMWAYGASGQPMLEPTEEEYESLVSISPTRIYGPISYKNPFEPWCRYHDLSSPFAYLKMQNCPLPWIPLYIVVLPEQPDQWSEPIDSIEFDRLTFIFSPIVRLIPLEPISDPFDTEEALRRYALMEAPEKPSGAGLASLLEPQAPVPVASPEAPLPGVPPAIVAAPESEVASPPQTSPAVDAFAYLFFPVLIILSIGVISGSLLQSLVPIAGISVGFLVKSLGASPSIVFSCSLLTQFVLRFILSGRPKKK